MTEKIRPYYIKVVNDSTDEDIRDLIYKHDNACFNAELHNETIPLQFGFLHEIFRLSRSMYVLKFYPYSVDLNVKERDTDYKKKEDALEAALKYLKDNGYKAKEIKLEEWIEGIDMDADAEDVKKEDVIVELNKVVDDYFFQKASKLYLKHGDMAPEQVFELDSAIEKIAEIVVQWARQNQEDE